MALAEAIVSSEVVTWGTCRASSPCRLRRGDSCHHAAGFGVGDVVRVRPKQAGLPRNSGESCPGTSMPVSSRPERMMDQKARAAVPDVTAWKAFLGLVNSCSCPAGRAPELCSGSS